MGNNFSIDDSRQALERIARRGSLGMQEVSAVTSPGARAVAWAIKVVSHSSCNVYNVITVVIGAPGTAPVEIGQQRQAVNLAESCEDEGTLEAGTYAVMFKIGDKNIFYAKP